jgi:hypothetical protein
VLIIVAEVVKEIVGIVDRLHSTGFLHLDISYHNQDLRTVLVG